ncbi:MAG: carbamoyl-phosphate synthase large subunit [Deltaproteobacteria bacterium]|nr:carbamoyl-phosphate synthase large subunit [Deltaproteobacteria bacterium]
MPKRTDIESILIVGSGPIVIGQACEFDYSGTQACKALAAEGYRVVLVNSNPATIMTDPECADRTYIEPLTVETLAAVCERERPDALLPTMGGQTALNLTMALGEGGWLKKYDIELIGADLRAIRTAEDRSCFKAAMHALGLSVPKSGLAHTPDEAAQVLSEVGLPAIIRPAFTLGGHGGSIAATREEYDRCAAWGLAQSPVHQILIESSIVGWKEFELEVMRDRADNVVIVCSIENMDPMGVHTGDSITVAPAQTLTDKEYQRMRDAAKAIIRAVGVDTGGANIQFAVNPVSGAMMVIEMNPRVSRSSALASKATGYPIAKIAAKLAVGYTLDELPNDITQGTSAAFEPTIDYIVTKIPRFAFEKFPHADPLLTTQMKSVGEVMAIGRTFPESLEKAVRSLEIGREGFAPRPEATAAAVRDGCRVPTPERLWWVAEALRRGQAIERVHQWTAIDRWFLRQIKSCVTKHGPADGPVTYRMVDTCAAEFAARTPYLYSTEDRSDGEEAPPTDRPKVVILGSGPNRIGQGIEFDYCCVQAVFALREEGYETIMVNCNPETVSTDYDTADRLYFEPLTLRDVMRIVEHEWPTSVMIQFGGQTPLKLAGQLAAAGVPICGTAPDAIDRAEDRGRFRELIEQLGLRQPHSGIARAPSEAGAIAARLGDPVMVRPSYVLGGRAMEIIYDQAGLERYMREALTASPDRPVLIDRFLAGAIEVDVDALADGETVAVVGIMEHVEEAGIHSGDSSCCLPPYSLPASIVADIERQTVALANALGVVGLINIQFAIQNGAVYVLEVNPRASRTVPFVAKATGIPVARLAAKIMMGRKLTELLPAIPAGRGMGQGRRPRGKGIYAVKTPVFPFTKFTGVDTILGPEMKSTGEVMGIADSFGAAFAKAQEAAGNRLPREGRVFVSVRDDDKAGIVPMARALVELGFALGATIGTHRYLEDNGVPATLVRKVAEGSPHVVDGLKEGQYALVINTTAPIPAIIADSYSIRRTTVELNIPYFTTLAAARAAVHAMAVRRRGALKVTSIQEWHGEKRVARTESSAPRSHSLRPQR